MVDLPSGYRLDADGEVVRVESRMDQWNREHYKEVAVRATKEGQAQMMAKVRATPISCVDCGAEFYRRSPIQKRCEACAAGRLKLQRKRYNAKAREGKPARQRGGIAWGEFLELAKARIVSGAAPTLTAAWRQAWAFETLGAKPSLPTFLKYWTAHRGELPVPAAAAPTQAVADPPPTVTADPPASASAMPLMPGEATRPSILCVPEAPDKPAWRKPAPGQPITISFPPAVTAVPPVPLVADPPSALAVPAQHNHLLGLAKALLHYDAEARRRAEELAALRKAQVRRAIELANQIVKRAEV